MKKKVLIIYVIAIILLFGLFVGKNVFARAGYTFKKRMVRFATDTMGRLAPPLVVYNTQTQAYEAPYFSCAGGRLLIAGLITNIVRVSANNLDIRNLAYSQDHVNVSGSVIADERFENHVATGTMGIRTSTGTIPETAFDLTDYAFYVLGGDAQITMDWKTGTLYLFDGIPFGSNVIVVPEPTSAIIVTVLTSGASLYYEINGIE